MKAATSTALWNTQEKIPANTRRKRKPGEKAATSTAMWKTEEKIPPNTRRRKMPGKNFINTYEETRKVLEEVDANQNETDLNEKTQKTLEDIMSNGSNCRPDVVSNRSSCRTQCGVEQINFLNPMWYRANQEACTRTRGGAA